MRNRKLHETERYQLQDQEKHLRVSRVRLKVKISWKIAVVFDRYYWKEQIDESMEEEKRIVN